MWGKVHAFNDMYEDYSYVCTLSFAEGKCHSLSDAGAQSSAVRMVRLYDENHNGILQQFSSITKTFNFNFKSLSFKKFAYSLHNL